MKKFLALAFVCAGLTAMAATPHVNHNVTLNQGKVQKAMLLKSNTLADQLTTPVMKPTKANKMSLPNFFADKGITPNDNKLVKKAPRRVSADDVMSTKIAFMLGYSYNQDSGKVVMDNDYLWGGWTADLQQQGDNKFNAYIYFTGIPFVIDVDYSAKTAEMEMGGLAGFQWADTTVSGSGNRKTYTINDTIQELYLIDEATMQFNNVAGTLYNDGTIYFPEGYGVYMFQKTTKTVYNNNWQQQSQAVDSIEGMYTPFFFSTYLMTANANHEFVSQSTGQTANVDAYMFQYDDTTAISWNLWGMGNRGMEMYIHENGTMEFPSYQVAYTEDISSYAENYTQYDWSDSYEFYNFAIDLDVEADTADDNTLSEGSKFGTVDANGLYWDASVIYDLIGANGGYYFGLGFYPFLHNKLTFTNGEKFLFGKAETPTIEVATGDDAYTFTGVTTEEGAVVYLMTFDYDGENISNVVEVSNPYIVERTDVDQTIYLAAIADGYEIGKNYSEAYMGQYVIPAKVASNYLRGDVNDDGKVNINDVTALIDAILSNTWTGLNYDNADCNLDEGVNINDVTALIDYVLGGSWSN